MAAQFVPNQNVNATIAVEAPGHLFAAEMVPQLSQYVSLDCLRYFSLSSGQANIWITDQLFDKMISFTEIRLEKVQGIGEIIMAATTAALRSN